GPPAGGTEEEAVNSATTRGTCPADERLAELVENRVSAVLRVELESHVAGCPECCDVVATAAAAAMSPQSSGYSRLREPERAVAPRVRQWRMAIAAAIAIAATAALGYRGAGFLLARGARLFAERASARLGAPITIDTLTVGIRPDIRAAL